MKTTTTHTIMKRLSVSLPVIMSLLLLFQSCTDTEMPRQQGQDHNFAMTFDTRSANVADIIQNMQLYTFYDNNGGSNDKTFHRKILNLTRTTDKISAPVEVGFWHMAMVSPPADVSIIEPTAGAQMSKLPMHKYAPVYDNTAKRHPDAPEIFFVNQTLPEIKADLTENVSAQLNRNVAKVILNVVKATPNFVTGSAVHELNLLNVPSTISYTGQLLPGKGNPEFVTNGLRGTVTLNASTDHPGFLCNDKPLEFIIPAHRDCPDDPSGVTVPKMKLKVKMLRQGSGSSYFENDEAEEIELVAVRNHILQVNITINDGIVFDPVVLPWDVVDMTGDIGDEKYANWIYVKYNVNGTGQSWNDPAPSIKVAIERASVLKAAGKQVNGILVAAGANDSQYYDFGEAGLTLPEGIKIFGGWAGNPNNNEELGPNDLTGPYTSTARKLTDKPIIWLGTNSLKLSNANTVLDGFNLWGKGSGSEAGMLVISNASAWVNAIMIDKQTEIAAPHALSVSAGMASNILVSQNIKGISVTNNGKMINATVTNNSGTSTINTAKIYNSIFWPTNPTITGTNDIQYSAFNGEIATIPSGTGNIHVNATNNAWFSASITAPGPHFKLTNDSERYKALSSRAPMLGRGNPTLFDNSTLFPSGSAKDINGVARYYPDPTSQNTNLIDIGCFQDLVTSGFRLRWASERVYVSAKGGYKSEIPLLLPDNETHQIGVTWTISDVNLNMVTPSTTVTNTTFDGPWSGTGNKVLAGMLTFSNDKVTPANDYKGTTDRQLGTLKVSTDLGNYLADQTLEVWQTPGNSSVWSEGYVGSFHRNNERGARYISGFNTGAWTARILHGMDWIKIDDHDIDYGDNITTEPNPVRGGYYKEVQEVFGGAVSGNGNIKFRVGTKSTLNPGDTPRYGLIVISRGTGSTAGGAMFFVRQGEEPDFLYRDKDPRSAGSGSNIQTGRANTKKFSNFNIVAPGTVSNGGAELNANGATWVSHPSKIGDFFQWDRTKAYRRGIQTSNLSPTNVSVRTNNANDPASACPSGYRLGSVSEWVHSVYNNIIVPSGNSSVSPSEESRNNFVWGRLADGYYEQLHYIKDPTGNNSASYDALGASTTTSQGKGEGLAMKGILMVNHYNYASVFFPCAGTMFVGNPSAIGGVYGGYNTAMYHTATQTGNTGTTSHYVHNTHWHGVPGTSNAHIGLSCTRIEGTSNTATTTGSASVAHAAPQRCVKINN